MSSRPSEPSAAAAGGNRAVPLQRDATRLKVVHQQRVTRFGDAEVAPEFVAAGLAPSVLGSAASGWQRLLETEYESVVIAGFMTSALARIGAPLDLVGAFGRVVEDEIRHVDLCAQMVETFGGKAMVPRGDVPPFPINVARPGDPTGREAEFEIIAGMVGFFCVFEHLSGLVFRQAIDAAEVPKAKWALSEIFRDEAFHGAFGFETAKHYVPRWDDDRRTRLADRVRADIARFEARLRDAEVASRQLSPELQVLERLGLLSSETLLATFYHGVAHELVPRLAELGVPISVTSAPPAA